MKPPQPSKKPAGRSGHHPGGLSGRAAGTTSLQWSRLAPARYLEEWEERLRPLGPERFAIHLLPGGRSIRFTAYEIGAGLARRLQKLFGGTLAKSRVAGWRNPPPARPIRVRARILIASDREIWCALRAEHPGRDVLLIPSEMAFGTGDHVTTATCLRWICDLAGEWAGRAWSMLDVGTGTGILAIAAGKLGAARVAGLDFDPHAVRVARRNATLNGVRGAGWTLSDITRQTPRGRYDLVAANLFSDVLARAGPRLARATKPGGHLIVSGILNAQAEETLIALARSGFQAHQTFRRGKWTTAHLEFDGGGGSILF